MNGTRGGLYSKPRVFQVSFLKSHLTPSSTIGTGIPFSSTSSTSLSVSLENSKGFSLLPSLSSAMPCCSGTLYRRRGLLGPFTTPNFTTPSSRPAHDPCPSPGIAPWSSLPSPPSQSPLPVSQPSFPPQTWHPIQTSCPLGYLPRCPRLPRLPGDPCRCYGSL
jgi:hypothetical protein